MKNKKKRRYRIRSTASTPYIEYRPHDSVFRIQGRSSPRSSLDFFGPVLSVLKKDLPDRQNLTAYFQMEYFNTSSSKCIYDLLRVFSSYQRDGIAVTVHWVYPEWDEDMLETGEDFEAAVGMAFNYIPQ